MAARLKLGDKLNKISESSGRSVLRQNRTAVNAYLKAIKAQTEAVCILEAKKGNYEAKVCLPVPQDFVIGGGGSALRFVMPDDVEEADREEVLLMAPDWFDHSYVQQCITSEFWEWVEKELLSDEDEGEFFINGALAAVKLRWG